MEVPSADDASPAVPYRNVKAIKVPAAPSIEDFVIIKPISRGAFGKVYLARKKHPENKVYAVKVVKKADLIHKNMVHQLHAERAALALSKSPFIVHLYYSLQSANNVYLVMEYLIGGDVKSLLHIYGYFDEDMTVKYISEVAVALDYLHRHGIIHRDLKPDNMLISNQGHIKLTDFGLSRVTLNREINMMDILNTPSMINSKLDYYRTPGQILSLISSLGFNTPMGGETKDASPLLSPMICSNTNVSLGSFCSPLPQSAKGCNKGLANKGVDSSSCSPSLPVKCLTPDFVQLSTRIEASSASSQSRLFPSSTESGCLNSPLWEKELQGIEIGEPGARVITTHGKSVTGSLIRKNDMHHKGNLEMTASTVENESSPEKRLGGVTEHLQIRATPLNNAVKGLVKKCLYKSVAQVEQKDTSPTAEMTKGLVNRLCSQSSSPTWESKLMAISMNFGEGLCHTASEGTVPSESLLLPGCLMDISPTASQDNYRNGLQEEICEKPNKSKRTFDQVDCSPVSVDPQRKKSNSEYKRGCEIPEFQSIAHTGLTREIDALELDSGIHNCKSPGEADEYFEGNTSNFEKKTPEITPVTSLAKNLLTELDEQCEKEDCKDERNCSFQIDDNDKSLQRSLSLYSAVSAQDESFIEVHNEKLLDISTKDSSFGEVTAKEHVLPYFCLLQKTQPHCAASKHQHTGGDSNKCINNSAEICNDLAPSFLINPPPSNKKKPNILFQSYCSPIYESNLSVKNRNMESIEKMEISLCTGSYPQAVTPLPRLQSYKLTRTFQTPLPTIMQTPYRTPKSVRRGPAPAEWDRILGTPDYLAPELLLRMTHDLCHRFKMGWTMGFAVPSNVKRQEFQPVLARDGANELNHMKLSNYRSPAVDWWALGVCLFEFLTGIPPFNDETPQQVFQNILNRDIPWPEGEEKLSENSQNAIEILLTIECFKRAGLKDSLSEYIHDITYNPEILFPADLKLHPLFHNMDWDNLQNCPMPFVPQPDDETDTTYFEARNNAQHLTISGFSL